MIEHLTAKTTLCERYGGEYHVLSRGCARLFGDRTRETHSMWAMRGTPVSEVYCQNATAPEDPHGHS